MRDSDKDFDRTKYLCELFGQESTLQKAIRSKSESEGVLGMQISSYEGQLLSFFTKMVRFRPALFSDRQYETDWATECTAAIQKYFKRM